MDHATAPELASIGRVGGQSRPTLRLTTSTGEHREAIAPSAAPPAVPERRELADIAAEAAGRAPGVASLAESSAAGEHPRGVVAVPSPNGRHHDLRVFVRAYLGDFLELGWAVRDAIRSAAATHGLEREVGLIDIEVVALVLPIEEVPSA